jgi:molecular chaperone GrpE (heat shock protein)
MASQDEFAFLEDYVLFGILVANQLCTPGDAAGLARLQQTKPATRELRYVLGADPRMVARIGDALQRNMRPKEREGFRSVLPRLPEVLENARRLAAEGASTTALGLNKDSVEQLAASLGPLVDELRDKRVELGNRERQLEAWADAAVLFLETVEALETNSDFEESRRSAARSLRKQFTRTFGALGFSLLIPERGERFDETQHMIESVAPDEMELPSASVVRCAQWGYRLPSGRLLKAKVVITAERKP